CVEGMKAFLAGHSFTPQTNSVFLELTMNETTNATAQSTSSTVTNPTTSAFQTAASVPRVPFRDVMLIKPGITKEIDTLPKTMMVVIQPCESLLSAKARYTQK